MNVAWEKSPERRAQLAARFGIEDIRCHRWSGNPEIDQMERAYAEPHHRAASAHEELADVTAKGPARKPVVFTPWSRRPDRVQDLIMRPDPRTFLANARDYVDFFDLDYLRSNLPDRKPLPLKKAEDPSYMPNEGAYSSEELRAEYISRGPRPLARREALARAEAHFCDVVLPASLSQGPSVITHSGSDFADWRTSETLPNGESFAYTKIAFPIPFGYSAFRVARMVADNAHRCVWCEAVATVDEVGHRNGWSVMLVSTGTALHTIATCDRCRNEMGPGPDYYRFDRSDALRGYPAERHR